MENIEKTVIETDSRSRSNTHRIDALEEQGKALNDMAISVQLMAQSIKQMTEEIKRQGERLTTLEMEPGKRWNTMTKTIFTTVVSTIAGGIVGALITFFVR